MSRLTNKIGWITPLGPDEIAALYKKLAAYEDTGLTPKAVKSLQESLIGIISAEIAEEQGYVEVNRVKEIASAETEGRLVILPCKVGDTVYELYSKCIEPYIQCPHYGGSGLNRCYNCDAFIKEEQFDITMLKYINKSIFLTREEAEIALKEETKAATSESLKEDQA